MISQMFRLLLGAGLCVLFAASALAADPSSFYTQNQSPLVAIYGLPRDTEARLRSKGEGALRMTLDLANNFIHEKTPTEEVILDGESLCLTLSGRYGLGHGLEVGLDAPVWMIGGGFLDGFIDSYHAAFGFPDGGRGTTGRNGLRYRYLKNGVPLLNMEQSSQGIGDVRLRGGWQLYGGPGHDDHLALGVSLKMPTGKAELLQGSGSTDLALWLSARAGRAFSTGRWGASGALGGMVMTQGKVLPDQQRRAAGFGVAGLDYQPADWIAFKIQANAHTSLYQDSELSPINAASLQTTLGGSLFLTPRASLDLGVTEDLAVGRSPDVVFHLSLRYAIGAMGGAKRPSGAFPLTIGFSSQN